MKINKLVLTAVALLLCMSFTGCTIGYGDYAQAVKEQNITLQLMAEKETTKREEAQRKHEEKMLTLTGNVMQAVAKTPDTSDDVIAPIMVMVLEDKWQTTKTLGDATKPTVALNKIEAPESVGDSVRKMGSTILGIGGIALGIVQSNNLADVAKTGINGAGVHDSYNTTNTDSYKTNNGDAALEGAASLEGDIVATD